MSSAPIICGIDFDNTLITYDELLRRIACERGLIDEGGGIQTKRNIRDRIRRLPDGEVEWQKCQAVLYGLRIHEAVLSDGVAAFLALCRERAIPVHIVSHKTEFSGYDATRTNLRAAALEWMRANRFFDPEGFGLSADCIFFADTRRQKVYRIGQLRCTHFIDDLEETFLEDAFPASTAGILYEPGRVTAAPPGVTLMRTWQEIREYFFGAN